jgi:hypothetical protein
MEMPVPVQETRFDYKGYPCVVLFIPLCHRCGYVGIPSSSKLCKGIKLDEICCHGGITYNEKRLHHQKDKDMWWIGFDCAHWGDSRDYETAKKLFVKDKEFAEQLKKYEEIDKEIVDFGTVRSLDYCIEQCKFIVDQLEDLLKESEE